MRFLSTALLALSLTSRVISAPVLDERPLALEVRALEVRAEEIRQLAALPALAGITNAISVLQGTVAANLAAINQAVTTVGNSATAQLQIAAIVNANVGAIGRAIGTAAAAIQASTSSGLIQLTAPEIQQVIALLITTRTLAANIRQTLTAAATALQINAQQQLAQNVAILNQALATFASATNTYTNAIIGGSTTAGNQILVELATVVNGLLGTVSSLLGGISAGLTGTLANTVGNLGGLLGGLLGTPTGLGGLTPTGTPVGTGLGGIVSTVASVLSGVQPSVTATLGVGGALLGSS